MRRTFSASPGGANGQAERMLVSIKEKLGKQKHQFVTWQEFCEFAGLDLEQVRIRLR